jgi:hypothetical protein
MPNSRELAILAWLVLLAIGCLAHGDIRRTLTSSAKVLAASRITPLLVLLHIWILGEVYVGSLFGLWNPSLVTSTAFWAVTSAFVLFIGLNDVWRLPGFFKRKALRTLEWTAIVTVVLDTHSFTFPLEFVLVPIASALASLALVFKKSPNRKQAARVTVLSLASLGLMMLIWSVLKLVSSFSQADLQDLALEIALPIWLTLGVLPLIFVLGLYAQYEAAWMRIRSEPVSRMRKIRTLGLIAMRFHFKAHALAQFNGKWQFALTRATSLREALVGLGLGPDGARACPLHESP